MLDVWSVAPEQNKQLPPNRVDYEWAENRLSELLNELNNLPAHNIFIAGSAFYTTLLKISSLVKGSHLNYGNVLLQVQRTYTGRGVTDKDIEYQFKRAYARSKPLERQN